jgi:hypothetical protein
MQGPQVLYSNRSSEYKEFLDLTPTPHFPVAEILCHPTLVLIKHLKHLLTPDSTTGSRECSQFEIITLQSIL